MKKVLVISPHPDDETLGAGGTLLMHKAKGDEIFWCNVTDKKEEYSFSKQEVDERKKQLKKVADAYGFSHFYNFELNPSNLSEKDIPLMIELFKTVFYEVKPDILYIPFYYDAHSDHRIVFQALQPFFKSFRFDFITKILMMEIISETDNQFIETFRPNVFVDITEFFDRKMKILDIYQNEMDKHPFPRSLKGIQSLAAYRGTQSHFQFAEAFMLLKERIS